MSKETDRPARPLTAAEWATYRDRARERYELLIEEGLSDTDGRELRLAGNDLARLDYQVRRALEEESGTGSTPEDPC